VRCIATDIQTGRQIVLDEGNVAEAIRASLSLPFFFRPYYRNGRYLVDGGLVDPVPTSHIVAQGANILISANLTCKTEDRRFPNLLGRRKTFRHLLKGPNILEILIKTIYTMQYEISAARSEIAHVVLHVNTGDYQWWDLNKADEIIRLGESAVEENLTKIKSLLPFFNDNCKVMLRKSGPKLR
ncbi:MAG: patatin-like phospholipase family protein, partial [Elusimicrobia bacterium]|nr:patatin-like phospholipase family protein [Candidatus Obscuribacterium magneticum]